jgi:hypothetical protein
LVQRVPVTQALLLHIFPDGQVVFSVSRVHSTHAYDLVQAFWVDVQPLSG